MACRDREVSTSCFFLAMGEKSCDSTKLSLSL